MAGTHKSFKSGSNMSLVYLVIVSFVMGWTTQFAYLLNVYVMLELVMSSNEVVGDGVAGRIGGS
jgi:hypothetical protein